MKHLIASCIAILVLAACNNNKTSPETATVKADDTQASSKAEVSTTPEAAGDWQRKLEELQKLKPYSLDELKALLPEELGGGKRTKFVSQTAMGASFAKADYELNDSMKLELNIFDCAGQAGAGIYNMQFLMALNMQSESDEEYVKTIDLGGNKTIEQYNKRSDFASLTWLEADRLLVALEGRKTGPDRLKEIARSLKITTR